ncbi:MAG: hypothetical protein H7325_02040 [Pedobacter sp.]|nr:hypothetical protein [Pedobacter sp.]
MEKLASVFLCVVLFTAVACRKADFENIQPQSYIAYFQIDSLNSYLRHSSSSDTTRIRAKLREYALKILKEKSIYENVFVSSFYSTPVNNGFILRIKDSVNLTNLKLDKRIDSVHKGLAFKAL